MQASICPNCRFINPPSAATCARCAARIDIAVERNDAPAPAKLVSICIGSFALMFALFYVGSGVVARFNTPAAATTGPGVVTPPPESNRGKLFGGLPASARDAAAWGVSPPSLAALAAEQQGKWAGQNGRSYVITPEQTRSRSIAMMGTPYEVIENYTIPPVIGYCVNKVENIEVLDYHFSRPGEHVLLTVRFEADTFKFGPAPEGERCGDLVPDGRKFIDAYYVWRNGTWMRLTELNGDPTFIDSVLKPDPAVEHQKAVEENQRLEAERREKEAERQRRRELLRQQNRPQQ